MYGLSLDSRVFRLLDTRALSSGVQVVADSIEPAIDLVVSAVSFDGSFCQSCSVAGV